MCSLSVPRKSAGANLRNFRQTFSQLSYRGFVCDNQGVAHGEDHKYIKPLKTVVLGKEQ